MKRMRRGKCVYCVKVRCYNEKDKRSKKIYIKKNFIEE